MSNQSMICEQGDMGLWNTPLSESDQKVLKEQQEKEEAEKNRNNKNTKNSK
ncbi:MAG: hypothetical protein NC548_15515 [Lachnospiraceae bacterium]|nr:hypothetical protein [Lachnospiraceae bacterium]